MTAALVRTRARSATAHGTTTVGTIVGRVRVLTATASGHTTVTAAVHRTRSLAATATGLTAIGIALIHVRLEFPPTTGHLEESALGTITGVRAGRLRYGHPGRRPDPETGSLTTTSSGRVS